MFQKIERKVGAGKAQSRCYSEGREIILYGRQSGGSWVVIHRKYMHIYADETMWKVGWNFVHGPFAFFILAILESGTLAVISILVVY